MLSISTNFNNSIDDNSVLISGLMQVVTIILFLGYKVCHLYLSNQNQVYYKIITGLFGLAQVGFLIIGK